MSYEYWKQWSRAELLSWQGIEIEDYQNDYHDDCHFDNKDEQKCDCSNVCMKCLGMSWADFM